MTMHLKDVFKEIFPSLPEVAQEKLKKSFAGLIHLPAPSKPTFLAQQQKLHQMEQKIARQGQAVTQLRERYDTEFGKLSRSSWSGYPARVVGTQRHSN